MAGLVRMVEPTGEPLALGEVKQWLRVDSDDTTQDDLILDLIATAREYAEEVNRQQLITATWFMTNDRFPYRMPGQTFQWPGDVWDRQNASWLEGLTVRPPRPPLQVVTQIQYIDPQGVLQTMDLTTITVDTVSKPGRLMPIPYNIWPVTLTRHNAVQITYQAGYGPSTTSTGAITAGTDQIITPVSMTGIYVGTSLDVDPGVGTSRERVSVTVVTASTFTATFQKNHGAGCVLLGGIPRMVRQALRILITRDYENRDLSAVEMQRVDNLLMSGWHGEYQ